MEKNQSNKDWNQKNGNKVKNRNIKERVEYNLLKEI
jgi:hypothetical protein